ncbi:MAG: hypothetical protein WC966_09725 [Bradymonadales bacterium]|jgi:hypothetical protein
MIQNSRIRIISLLCMAIFVFGACGELEPAPDAVESGESQEENSITKRQSQGPVEVEVILSEAAPRLSDPVELLLRVKAPKDVVVHMPSFGEQLGRFEIAGFTPSENLAADGTMTYEQRYSLLLPMSGKLRVPSFLIEFTDKREQSTQADKLQELQTEDFSFEVSSVLGNEQDFSQLRGARPALAELKIPSDEVNITRIIIISIGALLVLAALGIAFFSRRKQEPPLLPHELALKRLSALENSPIPKDPDAIDAWYVELSDILRHYIEGRFALSAPTRTTEEFFDMAAKSDKLTQAHKQSLRQILEKSDRVKFNAYVPHEDESRQALGNTRAFIDDTKPVAQPDASASA